MALAQRLNELAVANSEGLLSDDEYRLLRQNLFEEHSAGRLPASSSYEHSSLRAAAPQVEHVPSGAAIKPPKQSLSFSSLLRRATGRWSSASSVSKSAKSSLDGTRRPPPLILQATAARTSITTSISTPSSSTTKFSSISPSNSSTRYIASPVRDVFDEGSLVSAADLRAALSTTEDECRKLTGAFNDLEANTLRRIRKRRARRLPINTPESVDIVLAGGEWREHRLLSSPSSPLVASASTDMHRIRPSPSTLVPPPSTKPKGGLLTRSASHLGLRKPTPLPSKDMSDAGGHLPERNSSRRGLVNSNSTLSANFMGRSRTNLKHLGTTDTNCSPALAQTTHSLPYSIQKEEPLEDPDDDYPEDSQSLADDIQALEDVRRKRDDLVTRYTSRLEFLRARLKSVEIQEKLRKK